MRRSDSPQLQVCELASPSPRETGRTQPTMGTMQLFRTAATNHHYHLGPARRDSSPPFYTLAVPSATVYVDPVASTATLRPQDVDQDKQASGLSAGTIVAIVFSGLILIFLLTGVYACASSARHKPRRDRRSTLGRRSHYYEDGDVATDDDNDIEMQAQRRTRESLLEQQEQDQSQHQSQHQFTQQQRLHQHQQYHHHHEGAGMGYDDSSEEDGKEAWIEVGTAQVARMRRVPAGSVSITNIGRGKAPVLPLGSSQSVRDVVSLPDLAWAESLTTGGGRRPGIVPATAATATATATARATATALPATPTSSSSKSSVRSQKLLQERSESRRAVKRKAIKEWCARGSGGGGLGPYAGAC